MEYVYFFPTVKTAQQIISTSYVNVCLRQKRQLFSCDLELNIQSLALTGKKQNLKIHYNKYF